MADSLDLRGNGRLMIGITADWAHKPLVFYDADGDEQAAVLRDQFFAHLGASLVLWERLRLGVALPVLVYESGDPANVAGTTFSATNETALGDLRMAADVHLLGVYRAPISVAAGVEVHAPSGSREAFAGDGEVRFSPRLLAAGEIGALVYAGKFGFVYRANDDGFAGASTGSELAMSAAVGFRAGDKFVIGPELYGSTVVSEGDAVFSRRATPFEILLGGHYNPTPDVRVGAGFGPGLTRGLGAPQFRGVVSLEWAPEVEQPPPSQPAAAPVDRDEDGVFDMNDACPDQPGEPSDDAKKNGCPPNLDRDGDGVQNDDDACPDEAGVPSDDPKKHGCPPSDRDKDGVLDEQDACPDESGIRTSDPQTNGCAPPKDRDSDTIMDPDDACPDTAGPKNDDPKKHGCPEARVEAGQIKILERVEFEYNSAKLRPESEGVLRAVLAVLEKHAEFAKLSVEGHTDSRGRPAYNLRLSEDRARSVVNWLVSHGIAAGRLSSKGFGSERAVDTNDTDVGRQNNRRVEFHIREKDGKPFENGP